MRGCGRRLGNDSSQDESLPRLQGGELYRLGSKRHHTSASLEATTDHLMHGQACRVVPRFSGCLAWKALLLPACALYSLAITLCGLGCWL